MPHYMQSDPSLKPKARELRAGMTKEERKLWYEFLRGHTPRFQRQKPIGPYIVDFYCHAVPLAVELDGGQHFEDGQMAYDARRTAYLEKQGLRVLRFANLDVLKNFAGVCEAIERACGDEGNKAPL